MYIFVYLNINMYVCNMENKTICGIYKITSPSGRVYIGESKDVDERWNSYKKLDCKKQCKLYKSFKKHSVENHNFEVIEECSFEDLLCRERYYQDLYDVLNRHKGLNLKLTQCGDLKVVHSEETIKKMSDAKKGKVLTEEHKANMKKSAKRGEEHHNYGKTLSEEHINSIRNANKGSKHLVGIVRSEETKQSIREAFSKLVLCLETGIYYDSAKIAAKVYGITHSTLSKYLSGRLKNKTNLIYV